MPTADQMEKVFTTATATATSTVYNWPGGVGQFMADGTWDSATLNMEMSPDEGTTWFEVGSDTNLTAKGLANFELGPCDIRANLTVTGTSSLNCWMSVRH